VIPCDEYQRAMWTDGPETAPQFHLAECESCRNESRRAGDVMAALAGMRTRFVTTPPDLEAALIAAATRAGRGRVSEIVTHPKFWRGAAVGAAAAAAAATAAFGLIVARRHAARPEVA
jgi:predicted anti-sigma-YlaC factor YlaD